MGESNIITMCMILLLAGSTAKPSPVAIVANNWYCVLLGVAIIVTILLGRTQ